MKKYSLVLVFGFIFSFATGGSNAVAADTIATAAAKYVTVTHTKKGCRVAVTDPTKAVILSKGETLSAGSRQIGIKVECRGWCGQNYDFPCDWVRVDKFTVDCQGCENCSVDVSL